MGNAYHCPNCNGTEITWDYTLRKSVCPKDKTPVNDYTIKSTQKVEATI